MPASGPISIPYIRSRISLGSFKNGKGSVQSDGGTILIIGIPSHAGLRSRISIRVWPITGSRSTESLAVIGQTLIDMRGRKPAWEGIGVSGRMGRSFRLCLAKFARIFCLAVLRRRYFKHVGRVRAQHFHQSLGLDRLKREPYFVGQNKSWRKQEEALTKLYYAYWKIIQAPSRIESVK